MSANARISVSWGLTAHRTRDAKTITARLVHGVQQSGERSRRDVTPAPVRAVSTDY
jgi:hypothetical protein